MHTTHTPTTAHQFITMDEANHLARQTTGARRGAIYAAIWAGKVPGVRMYRNAFRLPLAGLAMAGFVDAHHALHLPLDTPNTEGEALYYTSINAAANATGEYASTISRALRAGEIHGAWQRNGSMSTWRIPVDGLWLAGFEVKSGHPDHDRSSGAVEMIDPHEQQGHGMPMPPLGETVAKARLRGYLMHNHPGTHTSATEAPVAALASETAPTPPAAPREQAPEHAPRTYLPELVAAQQEVIDLKDTLATYRAAVAEMYEDSLALNHVNPLDLADELARHATRLRNLNK